MLLSIIEYIGMNYQKEMPGYALELASSMELIYFDIHRSGEFISNPTKELLEKQIMLSMGVQQPLYEDGKALGKQNLTPFSVPQAG